MHSLFPIFVTAAMQMNPPAIEIMPWNGYLGAYSIIMDDFCLGTTTESLIQAEKDAHARGLVVSLAMVAGNCSDANWTIAKALAQRGNEIVNHSLTHRKASELQPYDIELEAGTSTSLIEQNTGVKPTFFAYPYDFATDEFQDALKKLDYLGSRSYSMRSYSGKGFNAFAPTDGFSIEYDARQPAAQKQFQSYGMDEYADKAVEKGMWAIRETHGVADSSYGEWDAKEFLAHLDHLAKLQDSGKLWITTPSQGLRYVNLAHKLTWTSAAKANSYEVKWTTAPEILKTLGTTLLFKISGSWNVTQNATELKAVREKGYTIARINPAFGSIVLRPSAF